MAKNKQSWIIRKGIYFILGGLLAIAAIFGWITVDQADEWLAIADRTIASIAAAGLIFAGTKTHRGSDEDVTKDDVLASAVSGPSELVKQLQNSVEEIRERLTSTIGTVDVADSDDKSMDAAKGGIYPAGR